MKNGTIVAKLCEYNVKRACVNATGVGRELYTSPFIWVKEDENNNPKTSRYFVKDIGYKDNEIIKLVICNEKTGQVVYSYGSNEKVSQTSQNQAKNTNGSGKGTIRPSEKAMIKAYLENKTLDECQKFYNWLDKTFGTMNYEMLSDEQGLIVCTRLKLI